MRYLFALILALCFVTLAEADGIAVRRVVVRQRVVRQPLVVRQAFVRQPLYVQQFRQRAIIRQPLYVQPFVQEFADPCHGAVESLRFRSSLRFGY